MTSSLMREISRKEVDDVSPGHIKLAREGIGNVVGRSRNVVETWDTAVETLMDAKKTQKVSRGLVRGGATFPFPEGSAKVVAFGEDCPLTDVVAVGDDVKMKETTS